MADDARRFSARGRTWLIVLREPWGQPVDRWFVRWLRFSPMTFQYAVAAGTPVAEAFRKGRRSLLLTTVGRRSGLPRTTVLPWFAHGDEWVICGTNGGGPTDPHWVDNIRADDRVWVRVDGRLRAARARITTGEERREVFDAVTPQHGGLPRYERQAAKHGREIPLVAIRAA